MSARRPHRKPSPTLLALLSAVAAAAVSCETTGPVGRAKESPEQAFAETVKPLLEQRCVWCHHNEKATAALNFQNRESVMAPGARFVVPGAPEQSRMYLAVTRPAAHPTVMPGDGWGITKRQREAIAAWIRGGAPWPEGDAGKIERRDYKVEFDDYL